MTISTGTSRFGVSTRTGTPNGRTFGSGALAVSVSFFAVPSSFPDPPFADAFLGEDLSSRCGVSLLGDDDRSVLVDDEAFDELFVVRSGVRLRLDDAGFDDLVWELDRSCGGLDRPSVADAATGGSPFRLADESRAGIVPCRIGPLASATRVDGLSGRPVGVLVAPIKNSLNCWSRRSAARRCRYHSRTETTATVLAAATHAYVITRRPMPLRRTGAVCGSTSTDAR